MEQTLGNVTHYLNLKAASGTDQTHAISWLPVEFVGGRLPWTVRGSWAARRLLSEALGDVEAAFIHTMTLAPACFDLFHKKPVIVSTDGPAMAKLSMREAYGQSPEPWLASAAKREMFRFGFSRAAGFVAWSDWAKQSLVRDYGCREHDVAVIPPGVDLTAFRPQPRDHERPKVLFVGGDFARKGGEILLAAHRARLRGIAELHLVTRDAVAPEPDVHVYNGVSANSPVLRELFGSCDLLALPTLADCFPLVGMEALAAGLPVVATSVGGLPDLVREGVNGHLVPPRDVEALAARLFDLVSDRARRQAMSAEARRDAEARFCAARNARRLFDYVAARA